VNYQLFHEIFPVPMELRSLAIQSRDGVYKEAASQVNRE
jgi:hypothetical protein